MLVKSYPKIEVELRVDNDLMRSMNYFDGPVLLTKQQAIDHFLDAMIRKMSVSNVVDYHRMQAYVDQLEAYPKNPNVLLIPQV